MQGESTGFFQKFKGVILPFPGVSSRGLSRVMVLGRKQYKHLQELGRNAPGVKSAGLLKCTVELRLKNFGLEFGKKERAIRQSMKIS